MKVLLEDHDEGMRAFLRPMLAHRGGSLIEAGDPWEAVELAIQHRPDVVLLSTDVYGEGREALQILANRQERPRLLLLGAVEPRSPQVERLPVDGYLPYPFDRRKLMATVRRLLAGDATKGVGTRHHRLVVQDHQPVRV